MPLLLAIAWLALAHATEPPPPADPFVDVVDQMEHVVASGYARGGTLLTVVALEQHPDHPRAPMVRLELSRVQRRTGLLREEDLTLARGLEAHPGRWRPWFELARMDAQLQRQDFDSLALAHSERAHWEADVADAANFYGAWGRAGSGDREGALALLAKVRGQLQPKATGFSTALATAPDRHRIPALAGALSVVPGAGHAYAGDAVGAAANLVVTGGLGTAAAWFYTQDEPVLSTVFGILGAGSLLAGIGDATRQAQVYNRAREAERFEDLAHRWWIRSELTGEPEHPLEVEIGSWEDAESGLAP